MARSDSHRDGEDETERSEGGKEPQSSNLILPPRESSDEEDRAPYANEMLLLSFEGRHKRFEVDYRTEVKDLSYSPSQSSIQTKKNGLVYKLRKLVRSFFKPIV